MLARLQAALDRASYHDFTDRGDPDRRRRKLAVTVSGVAFSALMLELLLTRLFPFFLGSISAFLAIPVAMFGLSLGALTLHWLRGEPSPRLLTLLLPLLGVVTTAALLGVFVLFNEWFNLTWHWAQNPRTDALKTVVLSTLFVPSFAVAGLILSTAFTAGARDVGRLYALDLVGSAGACLVTPLLLYALDLRYAAVALLAVLAAVQVVVFTAWRRPLAAALGLALLALTGLSAAGVTLTAKPDPAVLGGRYTDDNEVEEVRHGWNHVSRVGLLKFTRPDDRTFHWIVHDDGISNVRVLPYKPERVERGRRKGAWAQRIPSLMDDAPKRALVMFAGCGKDMLQLYEYAGGDLFVRGVELNGIVKEVVSRPWDDTWNLRAFYALPDVDLRIAEGRGWMERDRTRYDAIFVATNGAQHASRTGHARKFLDTREAMESYLDHLSPDGIVVFNNQRIDHKIEAFKQLLAERGEAPFPEAAALIGKTRSGRRAVDVMVVKPSGLSEREVARLARVWRQPKRGERNRRWLKYAPGHEADPEVTALATRPPDRDRFVPHDDRPYQERVAWSGFVLRPTDEQFADIPYALDWIKIFTLAFFGALSIVVIALFQLRRRGARRLPAWLGGYFLLTGICYMTAQIGLMAKLELFMGRPLYAISVVLASFLLANGAGSAWIGRRQDAGRRPPVWKLAAAAAGAVLLTLALADGVLAHLLWLPVVLKAVLAFAALAPLAFVLGCFYPTGVGLAVDRGLAEQVPQTFGLATLSSVLGSTYAMVEVINVGFRAMVLHALVGYLALAAIAGLGRLLARRR